MTTTTDYHEERVLDAIITMEKMLAARFAELVPLFDRYCDLHFTYQRDKNGHYIDATEDALAAHRLELLGDMFCSAYTILGTPAKTLPVAQRCSADPTTGIFNREDE